jgi:hypothetical protein
MLGDSRSATRFRISPIWLSGRVMVIFLVAIPVTIPKFTRTYTPLFGHSDNSRMARDLFDVTCPCCNASLRIDGELQAVISHTEPPKKPVIEDLAAEVEKLKGAAGRREETFQKSFAAEKNQGQLLNRKFDELLKQAKENPEFGKRPRDIDFD